MDLLRSKNAIPRITQPGHNIPMIIEFFVQCPDVDIHVRVLFPHSLHPFRSSDNAQETDIFYAFLFQHSDSRRAGTTGREHWVHDKHLPLAAIRRKFTVILHRLQGLRITVKPNMSHLSCGYAREHSVHHTYARAQDRYDRKLFACQLFPCHLSDRSFNPHIL